jgi:hypothetical protein
LKLTFSMIVRPMHRPEASPSSLSNAKWIPPKTRETAASSAASSNDPNVRGAWGGKRR